MCVWLCELLLVANLQGAPPATKWPVLVIKRHARNVPDPTCPKCAQTPSHVRTSEMTRSSQLQHTLNFSSDHHSSRAPPGPVCLEREIPLVAGRQLARQSHNTPRAQVGTLSRAEAVLRHA